jgi:hypothetical protein
MKTINTAIFLDEIDVMFARESGFKAVILKFELCTLNVHVTKHFDTTTSQETIQLSGTLSSEQSDDVLQRQPAAIAKTVEIKIRFIIIYYSNI